jgi:hypothetical protein
MKRLDRENAAVLVDAGVPVAEPGEAAAGVPESARRPLRELMDDRLLERSRDLWGSSTRPLLLTWPFTRLARIR